MIVLLHGLRAWGSVEEYTAAISRALGDDCVLVHLDDASVAEFERLGVRTVATPPGSAPATVRRLTRLLRDLEPDVVHVVEVWPPALVAARLARVPRVLVTHHTPELPRRDNLAGRAWLALGWATRPEVIYTSESQCERDGREPAHVVPLGIDLERFSVPRKPERIVGNVARLAPQKGHDTLLAAAPLVRARHPDVRFAIAGAGELEFPAVEGVDLLGARDDVPELLASFEVFAFPSRFEGLCLAVIEAQAAGVPVVATPVGGIRETVIEAETGWLVPVDDPGALAERISWVLEHPDEARRVADEARRRVRERYSVERMVEETLRLYGRRRSAKDEFS